MLSSIKKITISLKLIEGDKNINWIFLLGRPKYLSCIKQFFYTMWRPVTEYLPRKIYFHSKYSNLKKGRSLKKGLKKDERLFEEQKTSTELMKNALILEDTENIIKGIENFVYKRTLDVVKSKNRLLTYHFSICLINFKDND